VFGAVLVSVDLGLMNLILSVIVDKAQQAHQDDLKFQVQEKEEEFQRLKKQLLKVCAQLDDDNSGCLTLDELLTGFDSNPEFHVAMSSMDVQREDISSLFNILDEDGSGHVEYDEFVDQLHKMKTQDAHVVLVFIRGHVKDIKVTLANQADQLKQVEERLSTYEGRTEEILKILTSLNNDGPLPAMNAGGTSGGNAPPPQVFVSSLQQNNGGGCFNACSSPPQEKSQNYIAGPTLPAPTSGGTTTNEEVKALRESVAELDASLKRVLGAQMGLPLPQPPAAAQLAAPTIPPMPTEKSKPTACCSGGGQQSQEELSIKPLPPNDMIVLSPADIKGKGGKGFGKCKGGGKV
jgi:hypothetical protein